jgi:two-component system, chemotaxis family, chemotaxis protein CheY
MKALVIDDSSSMRMLLSRILNDMGVEVCTAVDGQDALSKLKSEGPFVFALVDWEMPVLDGMGFVKGAREDFDHEALKLIMVTSVNDIERVIEALEQGADEYIMKPFTKEALDEKLCLVGIELSQ